MQIELLKEFETAVLHSRYDDARKPLLKIFEAVEGSATAFGGQLEPTALAEAEATRVAAGITRLLSDPGHMIHGAFYVEINRFKRALSQIFEISGYRGTAHMPPLFGKSDGKRERVYTRNDVMKLFAGLSINAMTDELYKLLFKLEPKQSLPVMIGMLSEQMIYTRKAEEIRSRLLAAGDTWKNAEPNSYTLSALGPAYMGCSYAVAPHKHDIKKCFNTLVKRWIEHQGVKDTALPRTRKLKDRPKALIFAEFYNAGHAMHRCYGPSIKSMMQHFDTTLLIADAPINAELKSLAHHVETVKFSHHKPQDLIGKLQSYKPDIVYFPSVGMRVSSIVASTVRIAPIQVLTFGHPATTYSDAMDYVILSDKQIGSDETVSEKVMFRPTVPFFTHRSDALDIPAKVRVNPDVVRIAVPAWSRKITPDFLNACRMIREKAQNPVEFWFFPNATGALYQAMTRRYDVIMPDSKVLPRKAYNDYINDLNECDIFLSTYPFGATNGIVDAARQGLPIVNMFGPEVHTANDSTLVAPLAQPDWLTVHSEDEFVRAVVRLVDDHGLRVQISRNILDNDPDSAFFVKDGETADEFSLIMNYIYRNHEAIQASRQKCWPYEQIVAESQENGMQKAASQNPAETKQVETQDA